MFFVRSYLCYLLFTSCPSSRLYALSLSSIFSKGVCQLCFLPFHVQSCIVWFLPSAHILQLSSTIYSCLHHFPEYGSIRTIQSVTLESVSTEKPGASLDFWGPRLAKTVPLLGDMEKTAEGFWDISQKLVVGKYTFLPKNAPYNHIIQGSEIIPVYPDSSCLCCDVCFLMLWYQVNRRL